MKLYILRHGIAEDPGPGLKDADRALTPEGRRKLRRIAEAMAKMRLRLDSILSSPLVRSAQTAKMVAQRLRCPDRVTLTRALAPGAPEGRILALLARHSAKSAGVLLVGHEPELSRLVSNLVFGSRGGSIRLKKGGLCMLEFEAGRRPSATLGWLLTPRLMAAIAGNGDGGE